MGLPRYKMDKGVVNRVGPDTCFFCGATNVESNPSDPDHNGGPILEWYRWCNNCEGEWTLYYKFNGVRKMGDPRLNPEQLKEPPVQNSPMDKLLSSRRVASRYIHKDAGVPDWMKALPRNAWSLIKKFVVHEIEQDLLNGPGSFDKVWGKVTKKVEKEVGKDEAKKLEKDRKTKKKFEDWAEKEQKKARLECDSSSYPL